MSESIAYQLEKQYKANDITSFCVYLQNVLINIIQSNNQEEQIESIITFSKEHEEFMQSKEIENTLQNVFLNPSLTIQPNIYLQLIKLIVNIYESASILPLFIFELYLKDACSKRCWVDEKGYRQFINRIISVFKITPPENYSKQQINSIIDVAINIIQPILNHSVNEIAEGTVMVSCTLNAIPSFLPLVIPHIPDWLEDTRLRRYTLVLIERIFQSISEYQQKYHDITADQQNTLAYIIKHTLSYQQHYQQKLTDVLDRNTTILPYIVKPALECRCLTLCQICFTRLNEPTQEITTTLQQVVHSILQENEQTILQFPLEQSSIVELYNTITASSSTTFLLSLLVSCSLSYSTIILQTILQQTHTCSDTSLLHHLYHTILLIQILFSSTFHIRKLLMNNNTNILSSYLQHSSLIEEIVMTLAASIHHLPSQQDQSIIINILADTISIFVSKWKELYSTNEILLNMNLSSFTSVKSVKLLSPYGESSNRIIYYQPSFTSYSFFQILFHFLLLLAKYNYSRNTNTYSSAVDFVAIQIFERIFGIAYLQRFSDKWSGDWKSINSNPASENLHNEINSEIGSILDMTYEIVDAIKNSGKVEYYKNVGKTRIVFLMCLLTCCFPKELLVLKNSSSLLQRVMVSILKKEIRDRTLILTDDFSSIMNNILSYCDLYIYMKQITFSQVIQYYLHLNNSSITPLILSSIESLNLQQSQQFTIALTYLHLSQTNPACYYQATAMKLISNIQTLLQNTPSFLHSIFSHYFLSSPLQQSDWFYLFSSLHLLFSSISVLFSISSLYCIDGTRCFKFGPKNGIPEAAGILQQIIPLSLKTNYTVFFWNLLMKLPMNDISSFIQWLEGLLKEKPILPYQVFLLLSDVLKKYSLEITPSLQTIIDSYSLVYTVEENQREEEEDKEGKNEDDLFLQQIRIDNENKHSRQEFIEDMDLLLPQAKRQHISSYLNEEIVLSWLSHHELDYSCFSSNFQPISFLALWKLDMTEFRKNQHLLIDYITSCFAQMQHEIFLFDSCVLAFDLIQISQDNSPFNCYYSTGFYLKLHQLLLHYLVTETFREEFCSMLWIILLFHLKYKPDSISLDELKGCLKEIKRREFSANYFSFLQFIENTFENQRVEISSSSFFSTLIYYYYEEIEDNPRGFSSFEKCILDFPEESTILQVTELAFHPRIENAFFDIDSTLFLQNLTKYPENKRICIFAFLQYVLGVDSDIWNQFYIWLSKAKVNEEESSNIKSLLHILMTTAILPNRKRMAEDLLSFYHL